MLIRTFAPRRAVRRPVWSTVHPPSIFDEVWCGLRAAPPGDAAAFVPRVDVSETEESLRFVAELPGVEKGDLEVTVDADVVTIQGEKKVARPAEVRGVARFERSSGRFSRSFRVPFDADPDSVKGVYRHGVLTVIVPKPAAQQARTIPIAAA